jgi:hypothetical protein
VAVSRALAALAVAAWLGSAACGRFGYDPRATSDGDAAGSDGGAGVDAALVDGGLAGCFVVTTSADEEDAEESPQPPHLGSGMSLREAIQLANQASGPDCIGFARPMAIAVVAGDLPEAVDPAGLLIDGGGAAGRVQVIGAGPGAATTGLRFGAGPAEVRDLDLSGFGTCLATSSSGSQLGRGLDVHDCGTGILVAAADVALRGILAHDNAGHGILITAAAERVDLFQVAAFDNGGDGVSAPATTGLRVRHATLAFNAGAGIDAREGGSAATVLNSVFSENTGPGVAVDAQASLDALDYCDFYEDTCEGCAIGASSIATNPRFTDLIGRDLSLKAGSPCMDAGIDTGLDTNGDQPGLFGGRGPDLGTFESN